MDITCKTCGANLTSAASKCPECGQPSEMHATMVAQRASNVPLATDRQKEFARSLGIEFSADIDRQQISKLIAIATKKRDDEIMSAEDQTLATQAELMTTDEATSTWPAEMLTNSREDSTVNQNLAKADTQPIGRIKQDLAKAKVTLPTSLRKLTGESRRIAVEQPRYWEQLLFCEVMDSKLADLAFAKRDAELGFNLDTKQTRISLVKFLGWLNSIVGEFVESLKITGTLLGPDVFEKAFGPPGVSGNAEEIVYLCDRLVRVYRDSISRSQKIQGCITHKVFDDVKKLAANLMLSAAVEIENFTESYRSELDALINDPPEEGEFRDITLRFCLVPETDELFAEFNRLFPIVLTIATGEE